MGGNAKGLNNEPARVRYLDVDPVGVDGVLEAEQRGCVVGWVLVNMPQLSPILVAALDAQVLYASHWLEAHH